VLEIFHAIAVRNYLSSTVPYAAYLTLEHVALENARRRTTTCFFRFQRHVPSATMTWGTFSVFEDLSLYCAATDKNKEPF